MEQEPSVEEEPGEPTNREFAEACREVLPEEEYLGLLDVVDLLELPDFIAHVQLALEPYVNDPDEFLEQKGLSKWSGF